MNTQYDAYRAASAADVVLAQFGAHYYAFGNDALLITLALGYSKARMTFLTEGVMIDEVVADLEAKGLVVERIDAPPKPEAEPI